MFAIRISSTQGVIMKKLFIALLCSFAAQCQADFFSATDAYSKGDYQTAFKQFSEMASIGEKQSQFNLGVMYFQGQHVEKDINKAYAWIKLSTDSDIMNTTHTDALKRVKSLVSNSERAEQDYLSLAEKYSTRSLMRQLYPEIVSIKESAAYNAIPLKVKTPKYPRRAAIEGIQGWTRFTFDLDKKGIPRNIRLIESIPAGIFDRDSIRAVKRWKFKPAKDHDGNFIAQHNMDYKMEFHLEGAGDIELKKGVYDEILKQANAGDPNAQFRLGFYEKKLNLSKGAENPNDWFLKAAIQGSPPAQYQLGKSLIYGQGCRLDQSKGIDWLTRAANSGDTGARLLLASTATKIETLESQRNSLRYTEGLEALSSQVIVDQAWMLVTSPYDEIADPRAALKMIDDLSDKNFSDDITIYEIKAAANAALGKFKKAIDYQEDALEEAEDRNADTEAITFRLASYKNNEKWF